MIDYETPEFLQGSDEEEIHQKMLNQLPDNLDKSEGSQVWDLTRPTAMEIAEFTGFTLDTAVQMIFPQFATGEILDYHGEARGITRKEAIPASGTLTLNGTPGGVIEEGSLFSTIASYDDESISYYATEQYTIPESGTIDINVECTEGGRIGNAASNTIIIAETPYRFSVTCTNSSPFTNGVDEEDDETYSQRIVEYDQNKDLSYSGCVSDYKRWANEVTGVGNVTVIPASDSSGTVTLVITDGNGNPASQEIKTAVYNHIMSSDDPDRRLAPINAVLSVESPTSLNVVITATVELDDSNIEAVTQLFFDELKTYLPNASEDQEIRYTQIGKILGGISGVYDYKNLTINGGSVNVPLSSTQIPSILLENITLTAGTV